MLSFDVSVPEFGETVTLEGGSTLVGDGKSVAVTLGTEEGPVAAFILPAERALGLSQELWAAGRKADPEGTSLLAHLKIALGGIK